MAGGRIGIGSRLALHTRGRFRAFVGCGIVEQILSRAMRLFVGIRASIGKISESVENPTRNDQIAVLIEDPRQGKPELPNYLTYRHPELELLALRMELPR